MQSFFHTIIFLVWAVWTSHDLWKNQIQTLYIIPLLLAIAFTGFGNVTYVFTGSLIALILRYTSQFGRGDSVLLLGYIFTTSFNPVNSILYLTMILGSYIFLGQTFWKQHLPLAPGFSLALIFYYLWPIAL